MLLYIFIFSFSRFEECVTLRQLRSLIKKKSTANNIKMSRCLLMSKSHASSCYIGYRILLGLMHICYPKIHFPPFMRDIQASISQVFINYSVYVSIILMWEKHFFEVIHWSPWILKSLFSVVCFIRLFTVLILCFICLGKLSPTIVGKIKIETCSVTYCSLWGDFSFSFNFIHW